MTKTVLLIDYDPRSIARIRTLLNQAGYHTIVARDAQQGREEFDRGTPHLTLIQDLLPKGHGFEICKELKATDHGQNSPVVLLTAPRSGGKRHELLQTKCDDFVVKPFTDEGLLDAVRRIVPPEMTRRPESGQGAALPAAAASPCAAHPGTHSIPVEFSEEDIGSRLDEILLGRGANEREDRPVAAAAPESNGKRRNWMSSLFGMASKAGRA